jgi:TldD protein
LIDPLVLVKAVDAASSKGADYAEARYHKVVDFGIIARNGRLIAAGTEVREGVGVRVLCRNVLSFSATGSTRVSDVLRAVDVAIARTQPAAERGHGIHGLSEERVGRARVHAIVRKEFDAMSLEDKLNLLVSELWSQARDALREAKLANLSVSYTERVEEKLVVTSDGGFVETSTPRVLLEIIVTITHPQKGSLQRVLEFGAVGGLENLDSWKPVETLVDEIKRIEKVLLEGREPPRDRVPVVLGSELVGLIVHESAGHPMEADRIWGRELAQAGASFVKPEMIGRERIGNEHATVVDDPTIPGSNGFYLYDDEAVPARPRYIYREGVIYEPLHNRWSAFIFKTRSNAAARAMDYRSEPIVRMANTYLVPGDYSFEELLEEARNGVYVRSYMEWNIDDIRWGQRYVGLEAYIIRNGELAEPVRNPVLEFTTKSFYSGIVAKSRELRFYAGVCGKGEPAQGVPVWFGGPDVLLKPLKLGVAPTAG